MKKTLKGLLKFTGYLGFFLVALVFFVYLTLPLDQAKAFVIRYAADEHNLDVEMEDIAIDGLSGITITGATITPRATPEELEAIREARAARKAWEAARKAAKSDEGAQGDGEDAPEKATDAKDGTGIAKGDAAGKKGSGADAKAAEGDTKTSKKEADKPPPIPRGPQPLSIDSLSVSVSPFMLLGDLMDGQPFNEDAEANLEAAMLGGTISAEVTRDSEQLSITTALDGLDLSQLSILKSVMGLPLGGSLGLNADLEVPINDRGALRFASTTGTLDLNASRLSVGPGKIEKENLDIPQLTIMELGGKIEFEKKRGTLEDFKFSGKDVEGDLSGYIQLYDQLKRWGPRTYVRLKFSDAFKAKNTAIRLAMQHPKVKRGTAADGFTGYTLTGTFKNIKPRPRKSNPYRSRSVRPKTKKGKSSAKPPRKSPSRPPASKGRSSKSKSSAPSPSPARAARDEPAPRPKLGKATPSRDLAKAKVDDEDEDEDEDEEEEDDEEEDDEDEPKAKKDAAKGDDAKGGEDGDKDEEEE